MVSQLREVFPARMNAFPRVAAFVDRGCALAGFARLDCLRFTLVVEELFTNTVVHGHGGDSDAPVALTLDVTPGRITLTYEDTAPPHDPFAALRAPDDQTGVEDRLVGGLGVLLVEGVVEGRAYAHVEGRNRIWLIVSAGR